MAKKTPSSLGKELQQNISQNKLVLGAKQTLKLIKLGKIAKVIVSSNCTQKLKDTLEKYCSLSKYQIVYVQYNSDQLGALCTKPFSISIIGIKA